MPAGSHLAALTTHPAIKGSWAVSTSNPVTLSVGISLFPYGIAYRRAYGSFACGVFKKYSHVGYSRKLCGQLSDARAVKRPS